MNEEEMTETILVYMLELKDEYEEMLSEFGCKDPSTQRLQTKYTTLLIEKLGL